MTGRRTGAIRRDGTPHVQPSVWRRTWCLLTGGHEIKFSTYPRGICIRCEYDPRFRRN